MQAHGFTSRRRIEAFDAALSGNVASGQRLPSRELALAAALGAAGAHIASTMPRHAVTALRDNLMTTAIHSGTQVTSQSVAQGTLHAAAAKTVGGVAAKLSFSGVGTGAFVVPAAIGAIAANLLVGAAFVTAHHAGLHQVPNAIASRATPTTSVSAVTAELQGQLDVLSALEHIALTPGQAQEFLAAWSARTAALISLSDLPATVGEFARKAQAELDHLSALLPFNAITDTRRVVTAAAAGLPVTQGQLPTAPPPTEAPTGPGAPPVEPVPTHGPVPTFPPPTATAVPVVPVVPGVNLPGIDVGPIHLPPVTVPGLGQ